MAKLVIQTVNKMAYCQDYKSLNFMNCKKQPMLLNPIDTKIGIGAMTGENVNVVEKVDGEYVPLAPNSGPEEGNKELIVDLPVDQEESADLMDDRPQEDAVQDETDQEDDDNPPGDEENILGEKDLD